MAKKIVAGNWKMNKTFAEAEQLVNEVMELLPDGPGDVTVIFAPPALHLESVASKITTAEGLFASAQNCHSEESGAYTGEISAEMIKSVGADYVLIGHSERRTYFKENNAVLKRKLEVALKNRLIPVYCIGETIMERKAENHFKVVKQQIEEVLFDLSAEAMKEVVVAYEPVWAIGTGETATPEQAQEMHAYIRQLLVDKFGADVANEISLLYGGSCKPSNAKELFAQTDIDGGLIGGASLVAADFVGIIQSY